MVKMDKKAAMRTAKEYTADLFSDERISDVELEEIRFDHYSDTWRITVGFFRPRHQADGMRFPFDKEGTLARSYKVVCIDDESGEIQWLEDRFLMDPFAVKENISPFMDRGDVVRMAKEDIATLFDGEELRDVSLEEFKFDSDARMWAVTIGFARAWQYGGSHEYPFDDRGNLVRSYKTVHIHDETRRVKYVKDRFMVDSFLVDQK